MKAASKEERPHPRIPAVDKQGEALGRADREDHQPDGNMGVGSSGPQTQPQAKLTGENTLAGVVGEP